MRFFLGTDEFPRIETIEWPGFDGFDWAGKQDGFARDTSNGANEISLQFPLGFFDTVDYEYQLPDGTVTNQLTSGLDYILEAVKEKGTEAVIRLIINPAEANAPYDVADDIVLGKLEIKEFKTNWVDYAECKVTDDSERVLIKQNEDVSIDLFSPKGLFGNTITPISTVNMFLKGKPVFRKSVWEQKEGTAQFAGGSRFTNPATYSKIYGIKSSLVPFYSQSGLGGLTQAVNNFKYIRAEDDLTDVTVTYDCDIDFLYRVVNGDSQSFASISLFWYVHDEPFNVADQTTYLSGTAYTKEITGTNNQNFHLPDQITFELPYIGRGQVLSTFWQLDWDVTNLYQSEGVSDLIASFSYFVGYTIFPPALLVELKDTNEQNPTTWLFNSTKITIKGTQTPLSSVVSASRWLEIGRQIAKSINGWQIDAPRFDIGGEHYDNLCFSGNTARGRLDVPFVANWKDWREDLKEVCADVQVGRERGFTGDYTDYHRKIEMAVLYEEPTDSVDINYTEVVDNKHCISTFNNGYDTFLQSSDEEDGNTLDGVHTKTQWHNGNKGVQNIFDVSTPYVRDPFEIGKVQQQSIEALPDTSLETDDKIYIIDAIPIPVGYTNSFQKRFLMRTTAINGQLEILNNDEGGDGFPINWQRFGIGAQVSIVLGINIGVYSVTLVQPEVLTLQRISGAGALSGGNRIIRIEYILTNVQYINRTGEGFAVITGIESPDNFSNLRYHPKSNMLKYWGYLMATWMQYNLVDGVVSKRYYKNDPGGSVEWLKTQFVGEREYVAKADIIAATELPQPIESIFKIENTRVILPVERVRQLYSDMEEVRGYVRVLALNGMVRRVFLSEPKYIPKEGIMYIDGNIMAEPLVLRLRGTAGLMIIDEAGYDQIVLSGEWFQNFGARFKIFDSESRPLTNYYRFDKVSVNGVVYDSAVELAGVLRSLQ